MHDLTMAAASQAFGLAQSATGINAPFWTVTVSLTLTYT